MFEIGPSLRDARLRKKLDFPELETLTKVRAKYLRALEEEDFEVLPGQTYVKGFLRAYADALGLDGQLYVDEYSSRFFVDEAVESGPRQVRVRPRHHRRTQRNVIVLALLGIAAVTALVIAGWRFSADGPRSAPQAGAAAAACGAVDSAGDAPDLVVRAVKGETLVDVAKITRRGKREATCAAFRGTLEKGQEQRFGGRVFKISASHPARVRLIVGGRRLAIRGTCPTVVEIDSIAGGGTQVTQTPSCR